MRLFGWSLSSIAETLDMFNISTTWSANNLITVKVCHFENLVSRVTMPGRPTVRPIIYSFEVNGYLFLLNRQFP